ncbi:hypothetical protein DHEL01_v207014 [Diaporthe helianthi]|uniref:Sas10 C-terminal domain-containing protein n=1 Tax=Diaporthe helianthi TaxID=158607 RepID=A0A2P5HWF7_DIAHE|nr:hypothetical protein DHEL01_v207014 [Diaporthe helianthi]
MAKKRKVSRASGPSGPKDVDPSEARLAIRSYEDVADDQEQYFLEKDKIMLEDQPSSKRMRTQDRLDEFLEASDEEVLDDHSDSDSDVEAEYKQLQKAVKKQTKKNKKKAAEEEGQSGDEEGDDGWWGDSKKEYYNADAIETEADALAEEQEAKRLQKKKLAEMDEADFIFDEDEWAVPAEETEEGAEVVTEELKDIEVTDDMDTNERYRILQARYPEFVPLVEEFEKLQPQLVQLQKEADGKPAQSLEAVKHWILGCYVASLASYFAILTSPARDAGAPTVSLNPAELRDHEVMETLVSCREAWQRVRDLQAAKSTSEEPEILSAEEDISMGEEDARPVKKSKLAAKADAERKKKKKKAEKERLAKAKEVEESLADLSTLLEKPKKAKNAKTVTRTQEDDDNSDFGEEEALDARTAADKAAKKKSLRFYTSQIVQKASKRAGAGRDAGGDVDIPYRERMRDRMIRLNAEAEKRGKKDSKRGAELGGDDSSGDEAVAKEVRGNEDDYYDMVAHRTKSKKDDKAARKEALAAASVRDRVVEVETVGADGKRKINYQIEKNKGLAPKRKKEVRNSRVKKRKKYEDKQKKLKSMKATYQGGEGKGGYQGETTGIKTGLIKSVKL